MTTEHSTPPAVLIIEHGESFGGSIVSIGQTVQHLQKVKPILITFMDTRISSQWTKDIENIHLKNNFSYKQRHAFNDFLYKHIHIKFICVLAQKLFSLLSLLNDELLARKISGHGKSRKIKLVHSNNGISPLAYRVAQLLNVPITYHLRGPGWHNQHSKKIQNAAQKYIAITKFLADQYQKQLGLAAEKFLILHNPIDITAIHNQSPATIENARAQMHANADDVVYLISARIIPFKGQLEFIQLCMPLLQKYSHFKIALMGDSADENVDYFTSIQNTIKQYNLGQQITLLGFRSNPLPYISAADVIVHFSLGPEGFGRSITEAWAAKKPIIATAIGGPIELISDGKDGYLVDPHNIAQCQEKIDLLLTHPDLRATLGNNGFSRVLESFSQEKIAAQLEAALIESMSSDFV